MNFAQHAKIYPFLFFFLALGIKISAIEVESSISQLKSILFGGVPVGAAREEIDLCFERCTSSQFLDCKTSFSSTAERVYWETLEYPGNLHEKS